MVHNEYLLPGGEDESTKAEVSLLEQHGVEVETYWIKNTKIQEIGLASTALRTVWSAETYREIRRRLSKRRCDVVHVQNFFPLVSPSVYSAARKGGASVVQSLRNYRLLCANGSFHRGGRPCEECLGKLLPWPGLVHGCYRDSRVATSAVTAMLVVHRVLHTWTQNVDRFIALTEFAKSKFVDGGLPIDKIELKPNFVFSPPETSELSSRRQFFYIGRLTEEKGLDVLLRAWSSVSPEICLKLAGTGPLAEKIKCQSPGVALHLLGQLPPPVLREEMMRSRAVIFPSLVYEGMPRVIIEAFACGIPVIASRLGSMAEIIEDHVTGLHFTPGDAGDLAAKVEWAWTHPKEMEEMGRAARREYETKYTPEINYKRLMEIYQRAIGNGNGNA